MEDQTTAATGGRSTGTGSSARPSPRTGRRTGSGSSRRGGSARSAAARTSWLFRFDAGFGSRLVAGADEAGRGSLAGPIVAAAVLFDHDRIELEERRLLAGIDDSKQLAMARREELFAQITRVARKVVVVAKSARAIDCKGLHVCNLDALGEALDAVHQPETTCLVDGFRLGVRGPCHEAVVGGDGRSAAIAAASIVAKVTRDRLMMRAASTYSRWGFELNVGYSTPEHRTAILEHGICAIHRRSFQSIAYSQLELAA